MNLNNVHSVAIYPAIGIARVGNSKHEYFIGSTIPGQPAQDDSDFRDSEGKIKRQAAQFYVYGLDKDGKILGELNLDQAGVAIDWTVQIANKKAAWYRFDLALDIPAANGEYDADGKKLDAPTVPLLSQMRNREYQDAERKKLMIEPTPPSISGKDVNGKEYRFNDGEINDKKVKLGEVRTDDAGRLIFLGGRGKSKSFNRTELTTFANNEGWYDDTSDGPVNATVCITDDNGPRELKAISAWVVTAPPDFAVGVQASTTGYDLLRNVAAKVHPSCIPGKPEFYRDIYPMLSHQTINQWVNAGILRDFGWGSAYDYDDCDVIKRAADPSGANRPFRESILASCRNPDYQIQQTQAWPPLYGDAMSTSSTNQDPRAWLAVTDLQYRHLEQWAKGNFDVVEPSGPLKWDDMTPEQQANGLTEAALE
ncbi:MAG: LodA/GoxA family CTQ-dependent oxidase, partial [Psychrosphaera sp.]|nr:LodA/GoxA family CTQ-dependent oxidase [Psychrosphaera sp.]